MVEKLNPFKGPTEISTVVRLVPFMLNEFAAVVVFIQTLLPKDVNAVTVRTGVNAMVVNNPWLP